MFNKIICRLFSFTLKLKNNTPRADTFRLTIKMLETTITKELFLKLYDKEIVGCRPPPQPPYPQRDFDQLLNTKGLLVKLNFKGRGISVKEL